MKCLPDIWYKWKESHDIHIHIETLLHQTAHISTQAERHQWLIEFFWWVRRTSSQQNPYRFSFVEHERLAEFIEKLRVNEEWRTNVTEVIQKIFFELETWSLLSESGFSRRTSLWSECRVRLLTKFIPLPITSTNLSSYFELLFPDGRDAVWIEMLPIEILEAMEKILLDEAITNKTKWIRDWNTDIVQSIQLIASQVRADGLSNDLRPRLGLTTITESPFFHIVTIAERFVATEKPTDETIIQFKILLQSCKNLVHNIPIHMEQNGISVDIVLQIELLLKRIDRIEKLVYLQFSISKEIQLQFLAAFVAELIRENKRRLSIRTLFRDSLRQLSRKIVESNAEIGNHYIARNKTERTSMFQRAMGGGLLTSFTVLCKLLIYNITTIHFFQAIVSFFNYSISFLAIYFAHFTLATKQPANTAPTIARLIDDIHTKEGEDLFVNEVFAMIRTQISAIVGNLLAVFPISLLISLIYFYVTNDCIIDKDKAFHTIESFSILGATPIYAACTGVLLWGSSLIAGWFENWFSFYKWYDILQYQRRLQFVFGIHGAIRFAEFWKKNISAIAGNVSLGFLLAFSPIGMGMFGIPFDVRHVTLSTGFLATSIGVIGMNVFQTTEFWLAVLGIASMGFLNLLVSFSCAFYLAVNSRNLIVDNQFQLFKIFMYKSLKDPLLLFRRPKT